MATDYESRRFRSPRRRRRYRLDEAGLTEFDDVRNFVRFLPWSDCAGIQVSHQSSGFTVLSRSGSPIGGFLEAGRLSEFCREARDRWKAAIPHAQVACLSRDHRRVRRFLLLYIPLSYLAMLLALVGMVWLEARLGLEPGRELIEKLPRLIGLALISTLLSVAYYFLWLGPNFSLQESGSDADWTGFKAWPGIVRRFLARTWNELRNPPPDP